MTERLPIALPNDVAPKLDTSQAHALGVWPYDGEVKDQRFKIKTVGPWHICRSIRGLVLAKTSAEPAVRGNGAIVIHGYRTMHDCRESGYCQYGRVSIGGKKVRAFTSDQLFTLPDGKLIKFAILYLCTPKEKKDAPNKA